MSGMFWDCASLTSLDVSRWNTAQVTDMSWMFSDCINLRTLKGIEQWNTSSVKAKGYMFDNTPLESHPPI